MVARRDGETAFRIVVFSAMDPVAVLHLLDRLNRDVPGAEVGGILYERRPGKTLRERVQVWSRSLAEPGYLHYVADRTIRRATGMAGRAAHGLLSLAQASRVRPPDNGMSVDDLTRVCAERGWPFHLTPDMHAGDSIEFVRGCKPDLGIVFGTRILKRVLYDIPRLGSINIHKRKVPEYRGGGPIGLWELLDGQPAIGCTVHRVEDKVDAGEVLRTGTIPIQDYESLDSLALKADILGEDLLVEAVRDIANGTPAPIRQTGEARTFKTPKAWEMFAYTRRLAATRPRFRTPRGRPAWKLAVRSSLYGWYLPMRNWKRRRAHSFPVVVLYHHLVSERPHPMGIPTDVFLEQLRFLKRHYRVVSLSSALAMLESGRVEEPVVVLTFDDGYGDNFLNLRAALRAEPAPVTLFVCPRLIEEHRAFPADVDDRRPEFSPLTVDELRRLAAEDGVEIASHTRTHFDCASTDRAKLEDEIAGSREDLERIIGRPVTNFSFPWGLPNNMSEPAREIATRSYTHYFSAYGGANYPGRGSQVHLRRYSHPASLWELELTLQGILDPPPKD